MVFGAEHGGGNRGLASSKLASLMKLGPESKTGTFRGNNIGR